MYLNKEIINNVSSNILKAKIQSRHISAKTYNIYIQYTLNQNDADGIQGCYCTCKSGRRTIGCCSHMVDTKRVYPIQEFHLIMYWYLL